MTDSGFVSQEIISGSLSGAVAHPEYSGLDASTDYDLYMVSYDGTNKALSLTSNAMFTTLAAPTTATTSSGGGGALGPWLLLGLFGMTLLRRGRRA
ncbi:MAG: hypothetical protein ABFS08_04880 [Pseudomonadota bacterium]